MPVPRIVASLAAVLSIMTAALPARAEASRFTPIPRQIEAQAASGACVPQLVCLKRAKPRKGEPGRCIDWLQMPDCQEQPAPTKSTEPAQGVMWI